MRVWYFSEMAYHPAWEVGLQRGSLRVVLPNSNYDPQIGHQLLNRYLDEFALCDEVGLDIMVNEHHSTSTCLTISVPMALAIIGPIRCALPRRWRGSTCCQAAGWRWVWSRARLTRSHRQTAIQPI